MKFSLSLFAPLLAAAYVQAHGFVHQVTIDGKAFIGNVPSGDTKPSIIRQIREVDPVKGANNAAVNCGPDAKPASLNANANPGSTITFDWRGGDLSKWPHNTGPMLTYMASCGDNTCDQFDSTQAKWFKIQEIARDSNGEWNQDNTLFAGKTADVTIPSNLAPGNYLIRHEIIALHLGESKGGAEFYPSCAQLIIGGSQTGKPSASDLVSLPGAYSDTDPGILDKNAFNPNAQYNFPGPDIASFINGGSSDNNGGSDSGSGSGTSSSKPTSTGKCKLKKGATKSVNVNVARSTGSLIRRRPHGVSRVMRDLISSAHHMRSTHL